MTSFCKRNLIPQICMYSMSLHIEARLGLSSMWVFFHFEKCRSLEKKQKVKCIYFHFLFLLFMLCCYSFYFVLISWWVNVPQLTTNFFLFFCILFTLSPCGQLLVIELTQKGCPRRLCDCLALEVIVSFDSFFSMSFCLKTLSRLINVFRQWRMLGR